MHSPPETAGLLLGESDSFDELNTALRRGHRFLGRWKKTYRTRLHIPLLGNQISVNADERPLNKQATAQLEGIRGDTVTTVTLSDFHADNTGAATQLGPPRYPSYIPELPATQQFDGFRLTVYETNLQILEGIVNLEPVPIDGFDSEHVIRFAHVLTYGIKVHTS